MSDLRWWEKGIIYEVYPTSLQDTDGDGWGDLKGIVDRLDYFSMLGVTVLWIGPIYPSPRVDFGFDVTDYTSIDPIYGTMEDFDELLQRAHERGLKVILDFVPNHTSNQHPWFMESGSSRDNSRRDWYFWRDPAPNGGPPNNWLSVFGYSTWTLDEKTGQYYYHDFTPEEPSLNWRNPDVQEALLNVMRFWLERGIDGFRVDAIWLIAKDARFRNNPVNPEYSSDQRLNARLTEAFSADQPDVHRMVARMREVTDAYDDRLLLGEMYLPAGRTVTYYGGHYGPETQLPINHALVTTSWSARKLAEAIDKYEGLLPEDAWPNWTLSNHDQSRMVSRVGGKQARVGAVLLLTLRGTPGIYYGEEIGMHDVEIPKKDIIDPQGRSDPNTLVRDVVRTPMQWSSHTGAGFTNGKPWRPISEDFLTVNVEKQLSDPDSMLSLYRKLIALRQTEPALYGGSYTPIPVEGDLIAYIREAESKRFLVLLNLGSKPAKFDPPDDSFGGMVRIDTHREEEGKSIAGVVHLEPDQALVVQLI